MDIWIKKIGLLEKAKWYLLGKRHLNHSSLFGWNEDDRIPHPIYSIKDEAERNLWSNRAGELWQHLYEKHLRTLPRAERELILAGEHPSQSHKRIDEAEPYAAAFSGNLASSGYSATVEVVRLQAGLVGLLTRFGEKPDWEVCRRLPDYFYGFQVRYHWPTENDLTAGKVPGVKSG